jgi:hypothetical protein
LIPLICLLSQRVHLSPRNLLFPASSSSILPPPQTAPRGYDHAHVTNIMTSPPPMYLSPPSFSLVVDCSVFYVISHSDRLIVNVDIPHPTTIPVLAKPRVHTTVTNDACAQMPMHRCLQKSVSISICMAEGVFPRDLLRGRMIC